MYACGCFGKYCSTNILEENQKCSDNIFTTKNGFCGESLCLLLSKSKENSFWFYYTSYFDSGSFVKFLSLLLLLLWLLFFQLVLYVWNLLWGSMRTPSRIKHPTCHHLVPPTCYPPPNRVLRHKNMVLCLLTIVGVIIRIIRVSFHRFRSTIRLHSGDKYAFYARYWTQSVLRFV